MIALELGGSSRLVRRPEARRARPRMGPTGTATELPTQRHRPALRRRPRQRRPLLDRQEGPRARQPRRVFRRLQEGGGLLQARGDRGRRRRARAFGRPRASRSRPAGPTDRAFIGNIVEAMLAYATGKLGERDDRPLRRRPAHRDRLRPHDGGGGALPQGRPGAVPQARPHRHRLDQLAHAVHDERGLRAVPPAPRGPRHGRKRRSSFPA